MKTTYRKELKFITYKSEFLRLKKHLDSLMEPDEHSGPFGYMVRSLYFDSLYDRDLYDKLDGLQNKEKIRIRIYDYRSETALLELKRKRGSDGIKRKIILSREEALAMIEGDYSCLAGRSDPLAFHIYARLIQGAYSPKTIVEYNRLAYKYPDSDTMVTFDTDVRASMMPHGLFLKDPGYIPVIPGDQGVLEVKFNDFFPGPLREILSFADRQPSANSKYAQARLATY